MFVKLCLVAMMAMRAFCCSRIEGCYPGGEFSPKLTAFITFRGAPAEGATVDVEGTGTNFPDSGQKPLSLRTGRDGRVRVGPLKPGEYTIKAKYFGVEEQMCIRVTEGKAPGRTFVGFELATQIEIVEFARGRVRYEEITLEDPRAKYGDVVGSELRLVNYRTRRALERKSDASGRFDFGVVPAGLYSLTISEGKSGVTFPEAVFLLQIHPGINNSDPAFFRVSLLNGANCAAGSLILDRWLGNPK